MIVRKNIDITAPLTEEQRKMLIAAAESEPVPDEDCPELTDEQLEQFRRVAKKRKEERQKQTITLQLSPKALIIAQSLGKEYTSILSKMLEADLNDSEIVKRYL